jgi:hypothetical protein
VFTPAIPAVQEVGIGDSCLRQASRRHARNYIKKKVKQRVLGAIAQVVKHKALSSNPSIAKINK